MEKNSKKYIYVTLPNSVVCLRRQLDMSSETDIMLFLKNHQNAFYSKVLSNNWFINHVVLYLDNELNRTYSLNKFMWIMCVNSFMNFEMRLLIQFSRTSVYDM